MLGRYHIEQRTIMAVGEFSILWSQFEFSKLNNKACPEKIKKFVKSHRFDDACNDLFQAIKRETKSYLGCEKITCSVVMERIYSKECKGYDSDIKDIVEFLENSIVTNFVGCFLFIYRIRNNFIHGVKDIYSLNNQEVMFRSINELLYHILENVHVLRCYVNQ